MGIYWLKRIKTHRLMKVIGSISSRVQSQSLLFIAIALGQTCDTAMPSRPMKRVDTAQAV